MEAKCLLFVWLAYVYLLPSPVHSIALSIARKGLSRHLLVAGLHSGLRPAYATPYSQIDLSIPAKGRPASLEQPSRHTMVLFPLADQALTH